MQFKINENKFHDVSEKIKQFFDKKNTNVFDIKIEEIPIPRRLKRIFERDGFFQVKDLFKNSCSKWMRTKSISTVGTLVIFQITSSALKNEMENKS